MIPQGKLILGWIVVIGLILTFVIGVMGLGTLRKKEHRFACGFMCFISVMSLILVSNLL